MGSASEIEFPEVFERVNPGFDCFVGNPPYAGKNTLIKGNLDQYIGWLQQIHFEAHGNADLAAHFFRRAFNIINCLGTAGFVTTNTIAQGDTRSSGLRWICTQGGTIFSALRRMKWPGDAAVVVSVVHFSKLKIQPPFKLDQANVDTITAYLFHDGGHNDPFTLSLNHSKSFIGSYVLGMGFTFDDTDKSGVANSISTMSRMIKEDPSNQDRIFPYIGGEEVNGSASHQYHRYVINFETFPLQRIPMDTKWSTSSEAEKKRLLKTGFVPEDYPYPVASDWPNLLAIIEERVKPKRQNQGSIVSPKWWYRFARPASDFFDSVRSNALEHVFVVCRHQPNWSVARMSANCVFAESLVLFSHSTLSFFSILQSSLHEGWARFLGSSMKDDLRYNPTDCFETFPFPENWEENEALEAIGQTYYDYRAKLMVDNDEGLTKTYNRFHDERFKDDPGIKKLHQLHEEMDRAVLDAYGWTDISTDCEFIPDYYEEDKDGNEVPKSIRYRWPDEVRDEVLARLLALNAERYQQEVNAGLHAKKSAKKAARKRAAKKSAKQTPSLPSAPTPNDSKPTESQQDLF